MSGGHLQPPWLARRRANPSSVFSSQHLPVLDFLSLWEADSNNKMQGSGGALLDAGSTASTLYVVPPAQQQRIRPPYSRPLQHLTDSGFFVVGEDIGFERRLLATFRWTVACRRLDGGNSLICSLREQM